MLGRCERQSSYTGKGKLVFAPTSLQWLDTAGAEVSYIAGSDQFCFVTVNQDGESVKLIGPSALYKVTRFGLSGVGYLFKPCCEQGEIAHITGP
jgi:hypothetical protein